MTITDNSTTENIDLSMFKLEDTGNLTIVPSTTTFKTGTVVQDTSTGSVTGVNFSPVAVADGNSTTPAFTTANNVATTITLASLLANDSDSNGDTLTITDVLNGGVTTDGTATLAGGVITFTPTTGYTGAASFDYVVSDGKGATATATVTGTITAPVVVPTYTLTAGATSYNEGASAVFNLVTINVTNGTVLNYTLSGGVTAADITGGLLTGSVTVNSNAATITTPVLLADTTTEGAESLVITLNGATASTVINDTSTAAGTVVPVAVTSANTTAYDASTAAVKFTVTAGTYTYNISGFGAGDVIDFPDGATPTVNNTSFTDGNVDLQWALGGSVVTVRLTGIPTTGTGTLDSSLNSLGDFNSATTFGTATII